jgi:hypothetical protein
MNLEGMNSAPQADDAEIKMLQQQGWDVETTSADEAQRVEIENGLINAGMEVQVFLNPDNQTYTILRKAPAEETYTEDPAANAVDESGPQNVSDGQREKMEEVFPGLFGNPEDENKNKAA